MWVVRCGKGLTVVSTIVTAWIHQSESLRCVLPDRLPPGWLLCLQVETGKVHVSRD